MEKINLNFFFLLFTLAPSYMTGQPSYNKYNVQLAEYKNTNKKLKILLMIFHRVSVSVKCFVIISKLFIMDRTINFIQIEL